MIKKYIPYLMSLFLLYNISNSQDKKEPEKIEQDSIKTYYLDEIIVSASAIEDKKEIPEEVIFKTIYNNDVSKQITSQAGVSTPIPELATISIHNLPSSQFAGFYYGNIRMVGRTTQLLGTYSIFNPDLVSLELEKTSYSVRYDDLGGVVKVRNNKYDKNKFSYMLSSDLLQRIFTLSSPVMIGEIDLMGSTQTSIRDIEVLFLEKSIPEFKLFPHALEIQNYTDFNISDTKLEINFRGAFEENNYSDEKKDITKINSESLQSLLIARHTLPLDDLNLISSIGYEEDYLNSDENFQNEDNKTRLKTKNISTSVELGERYGKYAFGLNTYSMRAKQLDNSKDLDVLRLWGESKHIILDFLLQPSIGISKFKDKFALLYGSSISYFPEKTEITLGYSHLANFLIHNNGLIGSVFKLSEEIKPQTADHYSLLFNRKTENELMDLFEILFYYKDFEASFNGEDSKGDVKGIDLWFSKNGRFYYKFISSLSNSNVNGHKIRGAIDKIFQIDFGYSLFDNFELINQLKYQDGYYYRSSNNDRLENSVYLNSGARFSFMLGNNKTSLTFMLYNLLAHLGQRNEISRFRDANGDFKSIRGSLWGNVGLYYRF